MRLLPLVLMACGSSPLRDDPCAPGPEPTLAVGDGAGSTWTPLEDGDRIELVHGPQGSYHLEIGLEATHLDGSALLDGYLEGRIDGEVWATSSPWVELTCEEEAGVLRSLGNLLVFDAAPSDLHGQTADILAEVTDAEGTVVSATRTVSIHDPTLAR